MSSRSRDSQLHDLQQQLHQAASAEVARGQDAYFKGVIKHRGISTPGVDGVVKAFLAGTDMEPAELRALGLELLREPLQEDKLCGINIWQHCLLRRGMTAQWQQELAALEEVYASGHVFAWSTCDWICGRLLGPLIKQLLAQQPSEGEACGRAVMAWCRRDELWLRRSSVVAFVTLARHPDKKVFPGFRDALLDTLAATVQGQERFAQTGTGWVLRELGKGDPDRLIQFVESNLQHFSREGLRYALEKQPAAVRGQLLAQHKGIAGAGLEGQEGIASSDPGTANAGTLQPQQQVPAAKKRRQRR
ncbi:hypothetical protein ABPG77_007301 [Micractinium sp. CCAP 211/92]